MKRNLIWIFLIALLMSIVLVGLSLNTIKVSAGDFPAIMVVPDVTLNETLTFGTSYTVSIYTDYNGSDITGYDFSLSYNPNVLHGGMNNTNTWIGNGTQTTFNTTVPNTDTWIGASAQKIFYTTMRVLPDSESVYVNDVPMSKPDNYTINYDQGKITFKVAPGPGVEIEASYAGHVAVVPDSQVIYVDETLMTVETAGSDAWIGDNETRMFNLTGRIVVPDSDVVYVNGTLMTRYTEGNTSWTGDGSTTTFNTTHTPLVQEVEPIPGHELQVYVNETRQKEYIDFTANYTEGIIEFVTAPADDVPIDAIYRYGHYIIYYSARPPHPEGEIKFFTAPADGVDIEVTYTYVQYSVGYEEGVGMITFTFAPDVGVEIKAVYLYGGVTNGDLIVGGLAEFEPGAFNNTEGKLSLSNARFFYIFPPPATVSGPGILAKVTFTVVGYGCSNITLGDDTKLFGWSGDLYIIIDGATMPTHIQHGYFSNKIVSDIRGPESPPGSGLYPFDGVVDMWDFGFIGLAYGKTSADPDWEDYKIADTRGPENPPGSGLYPPDGQVDMWDFGYCGLEYGKSIY